MSRSNSTLRNDQCCVHTSTYFAAGFDAKDAAALAAIYADSGELLPPNSETIRGRTAIEAYFTESLASDVSIGLEDTGVYAHGDVGYMEGTYTVT
ncbi:MAG: nuclear transport factor 2 family protein, partial [Woeseia sp.]